MRQGARGFTLAELAMVAALVVILASVVIPVNNRPEFIGRCNRILGRDTGKAR